MATGDLLFHPTSGALLFHPTSGALLFQGNATPPPQPPNWTWIVNYDVTFINLPNWGPNVTEGGQTYWTWDLYKIRRAWPYQPENFTKTHTDVFRVPAGQDSGITGYGSGSVDYSTPLGNQEGSLKAAMRFYHATSTPMLIDEFGQIDIPSNDVEDVTIQVNAQTNVGIVAGYPVTANGWVRFIRNRY